jgi:hypothetical protein
MLLYVPTVLVQLGAGVLVVLSAWLISDLPLGTARGVTDAHAAS